MGDVADMLGVEKAEAPDPLAVALGITKRSAEKKVAKPIGMSREVFALLGRKGLPPSMPAVELSALRESKDSQYAAVKWDWVQFSNSARTDDVKFHHWVKAAAEYSDYPFAQYNVQTTPIEYSEHEYRLALDVPDWTKAETDELIRLCARYDMCWPVIYDRFESDGTSRPVELLQERFYTLVEKLRKFRASVRERSDEQYVGLEISKRAYGLEEFNLEYEQARRKQLEIQFYKDSTAEKEEESIREELKELEFRIKKLKQKKKQDEGEKVATELSTMRQIGSTISKGGVKVNSSNPVCRPYLQSNRLNPALQAPTHQLGKIFMKKVQAVITELHVPENLMPTQTVCDLQDALKKDIVTLLTLQKVAAKMENDLNFIQDQVRNPQPPSSVPSLESFSASAANQNAKRRATGSIGTASKEKRIRK